MDGCNCMVPAGQKYCSAYCESAKGQTKLQCHCGHPGCDGQKL
jgi:metallothionein